MGKIRSEPLSLLYLSGGFQHNKIWIDVYNKFPNINSSSKMGFNAGECIQSPLVYNNILTRCSLD